MFRGSASQQKFSGHRGTSHIDLTLSSDEEDSPVKLSKSSRPRPPVLDSDSEDGDDSELEIVPKISARSSPSGIEGEISSTKSAEPRRAVQSRSVTEETNSVDSSSEEEEEQEEEDEEEDEIENDSLEVTKEQSNQSRPALATTSGNTMADALASLSFKKKPSPTRIAAGSNSTKLDSDQENALRKQGFLSASSKSQTRPTEPRSLPAPQPSTSNQMFFKPKFSSTFRTSQNPHPSSSSGFASNLNAFNPKPQPISIKERLGAQLKEENKSKGIPIAVPMNPPPSIVRREGKVAPKRVIDVDAELEAFGEMEIKDGTKEEEAVAAFRKGLGVANVEVDEDELEEVPPPPHLVCKLLPHQVDSLRWLKGRESGEGLEHGGLLADDMGLGKTVQMLALILSNPFDAEDEDVKTSKTTLIVAPVGLLEQWKLEVENKLNKKLRVEIYHGPKRKNLAKKLHLYDVIVTNYETVASDKNSASGLFDSKLRPFHRLILDEAHTIKNHKTKKAEACCEVKARFRWALTGTPIQNSVDDLFSIFKFLGKRVVPRSLWSKTDFDQWIGIPIKSKQNKLGFERLASILSEIMKRRTKNTTVNGKPILPLPARIVNIVRSSFIDPDEEAFYKSIEEKMVLQYNKFLKGGSSGSDYAQVLVRLLRMRQATLHPALVTKASIETDSDALDPTLKNDDDPNTPKKVQAGGMTPSCTVCGHPTRSKDDEYCSTCAADFDRVKTLQSSTKVTKTMQLLQQFRNETKGSDKDGRQIPKKKVIIFSQFTSMLLLLEKFLKAGGYGFVRFDGSCTLPQRNAAIEKITNDPNTTIILISIKAGAVGLNLTMCSRVILLDLWWNPAIESQAFDRAHRYGQKEDVEIYKLVIDNTVEDRILTLQAQKADLAASALDGGAATKVKLTQKERDFLFRGFMPTSKKKSIDS
ncbi:hypothetical protein JCM3765_004377 [Sporobolomyces pararoseus]